MPDGLPTGGQLVAQQPEDAHEVGLVLRGQCVEQRRSPFDVFTTEPVHDPFTLARQGDERRPAVVRMPGTAYQTFVLEGVHEPGDGPGRRSEILDKIAHDRRMRMVSQSRQ